MISSDLAGAPLAPALEAGAPDAAPAAALRADAATEKPSARTLVPTLKMHVR
jgi:hypothetical protein